MIHSKQVRKRSLSKKTLPSKKETATATKSSSNELYGAKSKLKDHFSESVVAEASHHADGQETCPPGIDSDRFVTELIWNPRETSASQMKNNVAKACSKNGGTLQAADGISTTEALEAENCGVVDGRSDAALVHGAFGLRSKFACCDVTESAHAPRHRNDKTGEIPRITLVFKHDVTDDGSEESSFEQNEGTSIRDEDDFLTKACLERKNQRCTRSKDRAVSKRNQKGGDEILKETVCGASGLNIENAFPTTAFSAELNNRVNCDDNLDCEDPKFCLNTEYYPVEKNYHPKHVSRFNYRVSTTSDDDGSSTCLSSDAELGIQLEDDRANDAPPTSSNSMDYCVLEHETGLRNPIIQTVQHENIFPTSSDCSVARKESRNSSQTFRLSRRVSHSDISNLTLKPNPLLGCSVDVYYEVLSDPACAGWERSSEELTYSRQQSLEDIVPELPSRFSSSTHHLPPPSGFVPNLFWWRRPSNITELRRSQVNHPCCEEGDATCENTVESSTQRRYSENVFCKPKKFLTFRFNKLREMWNNRDKTPHRAAKPKVQQQLMTESTELHESNESKDHDRHFHTAEKNEMIINTLREVVRKCTFMDPLQRPRSHEVYKKLQKLLVL